MSLENTFKKWNTHTI